MTTGPVIADLYAKHGVGAKFVRAYCKAMGWRYDAQGAPAAWYKEWQGRTGLAAVLDELARSKAIAP